MPIPMQQMLLSLGAKKKSTYIDDLFSTYVYKGNESARAINNGIDLSGEGGLVWVKSRNDTHDHHLIDTVRGANDILESNTSDAEATVANRITGFNSNGFNLGSAGQVNGTSAYDYSSWSFRKAPGFFIIKEYSGTGSSQSVSHDLGNQPGMIFIKRTDSSGDWMVYHRDLGTEPELGQQKYLVLNGTNASYGDGAKFSAAPTATTFSVGTSSDVNASGGTYIAYIFAGGKSTTDKAVEFDGTNDYLTIPDNDDWNLGDTFTIEAWVNLDVLNGYNVIISQSGSGGNSWYMSVNSNGSCQFYDFNGGEQIDSASSAVSANTWTHIAIVANSGTAQWYVNGTASGSSGSLNVAGNTSNVNVGAQNGGFKVNGEISNLRVTKGQAIYTSNFAVPDKKLTQTSQGAISSNVKLLCCNGSSATASTVTPDTISATGSPSVTTNNSIFDDPAGFAFGDSGDQNVIKCGSYTGNGSSTGPEINLGWEPQWILIKNASASQGWRQFDSMRGIPTGGSDARLFPNNSDAESAAADYIDLTSTGFKIKDNGGDLNGNGNTIIYMAIRRPDGYVGKPPELGTDVFNMVMGTSNSDIPAFVSGFVTDFAFNRQPAGSENWWTQSRITGDKYLVANNNDAESTSSPNEWDFMNGWYSSTSDFSNQQSWMWKRHAGFDVVTYKGNGSWGHNVPHSMNKVPEMMWVKNRSSSGEEWMVYHKGLDGGNQPETHYLLLHSNDEEADSNGPWNDTAPSSTNFTLGGWNSVNANNSDFIAMLFASVDGISKVGYYTGNGTSDSSTQTITTGFQPRFVIIKSSSNDEHWVTFDTTRGWSSGSADKVIELNNTDAQFNFPDIGHPISTGFVIKDDQSVMNLNNHKYIYYAHA